MLEFAKDEQGRVMPIKNKSQRKICTPEELVFFFKYCFSPNERRYKYILLSQLGCECRVHEACAINLKDFVKGSNYRELDMLIQKKVRTITLKDGTTKKVGCNVIERKYIPESIAAYLRQWIKENWTWILEHQGYVFPRSIQQKDEAPYTSPTVVQRWFCKKRQQLIKLYPDKSFGETISTVVYNSIENQKTKFSRIEGRYLWSSHMFKRFAGTYLYFFTKDPKFTQAMLSHEKFETTQKHYIDNATIMGKAEKVKNSLYDVKFYESIKRENEDVVAVWENDLRK